MAWLAETLGRLAARPLSGYYLNTPPSTEPTALAVMALAAHGSCQKATPALAWLQTIQSPRGSLGVDQQHPGPCWATGWAALAWQISATTAASANHVDSSDRRGFSASARRAIDWLLATKGTAQRRNAIMGHDTTLQAWPWVEETHSWIEPTAISLLALKATGHANHPRSREAVRLLLDRMLPDGGWNQGNKIVMGRTLRPQLQPTGLALAALAGEEAPEAVSRSMRYLNQAIAQPVSTASLSYALIGMAAHGPLPLHASRRLEACVTDTLAHDAAPYPLALAALAALGPRCPWFARPFPEKSA